MVGRRILPLLLVALLLSGCAAEGGPSATSTGSSAPPTVAAAAAQTASQASTTSAPTTSSSSSSSTSSSSSPTAAPTSSANSTTTNSTQPPPPPAAPAIPTAPVVGTCGTSIPAGVGTDADVYFFLEAMMECGPGDLASKSGGPFRSAVIELTWSTALPTVTKASFTVRERFGEIDLGKAEGTNATLRLTLSGPEFPALASLDLVATVGASGLVVDYKGTLTFSLFETPEPPAGYSGVA